jgi:hypothetical protein
MPGADRHPLFPVVAGFAAYGATMANDFERAEARITAAEEAQGSLDPPSPSVLRARAVLALFRGDITEAAVQARAWVDLARASGDAYELAHALTMLGSALGFAERHNAIAPLDEAVSIARDAGILSALSIGLVVLAGLLPDDESERALALFDEGVEVGTQIGDHISVSFATGTKGWTAARRGDWRTALEAAVDSAEQRLQLGDVMSLPHSFHLAVAAFAALGKPGPAAVLLGKTDAMAPYARPLDWAAEMLEAANEVLLDTLGAQEVATLAAQGAALEAGDAVTYLRAQGDLVLDDN